MKESIRSGDAVFGCDEDLRVSEWNPAATKLTGLARADAIGKPCWDVIAGRNDRDELVCHPGCKAARLIRDGWPVDCRDLVLATPAGRRRISISTIVVGRGARSLILHPIRVVDEQDAPAGVTGAPRLTRRQLEILGLLADGVRAREIAARLTLSETTVRNHIRALLHEFGAHSQLEAVALARGLALVA